jgi:hypothetical protein
VSRSSFTGFTAVHHRVWLADRLPDLFRSVGSSPLRRGCLPLHRRRGLLYPHQYRRHFNHGPYAPVERFG